jgi:hypothetical protein
VGSTITAEQGTLSGEQKSALTSMAQEEKLTHDLYATFADRYDAVVFEHIAASESRHLAAVRLMLQRYDITDPTSGCPAGTFTDPAVQESFDKLVKQGEVSLPAALAVGQQVERDDVADLATALDRLDAPDVEQVTPGC